MEIELPGRGEDGVGGAGAVLGVELSRSLLTTLNELEGWWLGGR